MGEKEKTCCTRGDDRKHWSWLLSVGGPLPVNVWMFIHCQWGRSCEEKADILGNREAFDDAATECEQWLGDNALMSDPDKSITCTAALQCSALGLHQKRILVLWTFIQQYIVEIEKPRMGTWNQHEVCFTIGYSTSSWPLWLKCLRENVKWDGFQQPASTSFLRCPPPCPLFPVYVVSFSASSSI